MLYRDIRNAYYSGIFSQVEKPHEVYDEIISKIDSSPQTAEEMFGLLKSMALRAGDDRTALDSHFRIPLKLTPPFSIAIFSYIYRMEEESLQVYLPDVVLSLDGKLSQSHQGMYTLRPGLAKIRYGSQVYTVMLIGEDKQDGQ